MGKIISEQDVDKFMKEVDRNNDGKIQKGEMYLMLKKFKQKKWSDEFALFITKLQYYHY